MTAAAAAEKKKKKDELYYKFNTSRGMGYLKSRLRNYDDATALYTSAIEHAEPGMETPLVIARSKAFSKLVDHDAARRDAQTVIDSNPNLIQGLENDAYTLYEKDDFEDALVRYYRGLRRRKKPDYFYKGILVGKETIEDCIGRNAGPCLDHDRLGQIIVDMHMKPRPHDWEGNELEEARKKHERERFDRFFSQKYLGRQAIDKQFLKEFVQLPDLKSGNKEHNEQLQALLTHRIGTLDRQMETLMTQRPFYMLKHHDPKFSNRYKKQRKKEEKRWRGGVMKVIGTLQEEARKLRVDGKIEDCLNVCERLRRFLECQPRCLLGDSTRAEEMDTLYTTIGKLYMDTKRFQPEWSEADNEKRIEVILHSRVDDEKRFNDRVQQTYFPKIWNVKEKKRELESRLSTSIHKMERTYLYHEIARCLLEEAAIANSEKAYKAARQGYNIAKDIRSTLWCFNNGFLTATAVLLEGNADDAKIGYTEVMINARKLERDDCASFVQKVIKLSTEPNRLVFEGPDENKKREREILNMMPNADLKAKAETIIQKVARSPHNAKLQLQPSSTFKAVAQGCSRRSMKITTRAKRQTLFEVKSSRFQPNEISSIKIPKKIE